MKSLRIQLDREGWMQSKAGHHKFRITHICPACLQEWSFDITDDRETAMIPPDVQLGLSMLCGYCEARRRVSFVWTNAAGKRECAAIFFDEEKEAKAWARIRKGERQYTKAEDFGVYDGGKLRNDKVDALRIVMRRKIRDGVYQNISSMTHSQFADSGLKWEIPKRPVAEAVKW